MQPTATDVDRALSSLGTFGRWQMLVYSMVCSSVTVSGCWHMMSIMFVGGEPEHHCHIPQGVHKNSAIPFSIRKGQLHFAQCERYLNYSASTNATIPCTEWDFDKSEFETSIVSEWQLVCDYNYLVEASQSVFNFGVMLGAIIFSSMADQIGRKPVHLSCQWGMIIIGSAIAFTRNYPTFVALRLLLGALREGAGLSGIVMACELFPASERTFAGAALELFWAAGWMLLALIAYGIREWRTLQLTLSLPFIITVAEIWLLPESVPWLAANDRHQQAEEILQRAAAFNGIRVEGKALLTHYDSQDMDEPDLLTPLNKPRLARDENRDDEEAIRIPPSDGIYNEDNTADNSTVNYDATKDNIAKSGERKETNRVIRDNTPMTAVFETADEETQTSFDVISQRCCENNEIVDYFRDIKNRFRRQHNTPSIDSEHVKHHYTLASIVKSKTMLLNTFVMCSLWFASGVVYYGLSLSTSSLAGDKYVNFLLSGAVEAPAYLLTVFVLKKFGRRWPLCIFHIIAGASLFVSIFIPETMANIDTSMIIVSLNMLGKFAMTAAFGTVVLYAPEIYPTNIRNFGFGIASCWARIGGMIAPVTAYVNKTHPWISLTIFTVIAIVTGLMALLLPETLNRPLPDTIEEIEAWTRSAPSEQEIMMTHRKIATVIKNSNCDEVIDDV